MPENERHVEISLNLDASGLEQGLDQASRKIDQFQQQSTSTTGSFDPNVALGAAGFSQNTPPSGSSSPAIPGGGFSASGGSLFLPPQTDPGVAVGAAGLPQMPSPMGGAPAPGNGRGDDPWNTWGQRQTTEDRLKSVGWTEPPVVAPEIISQAAGVVPAPEVKTPPQAPPQWQEYPEQIKALWERYNQISETAQQTPDVASSQLNQLRREALKVGVSDPESGNLVQELVDSTKGLKDFIRNSQIPPQDEESTKEAARKSAAAAEGKTGSADGEEKEAKRGLIESLLGLKGTVQEDGKKRKDHLTEIFQFDAMMRLGRQVGQDVSQGRMFSAVGGGVGGALGLFGGPMGRLVGGGLSAAGGLLDQLMGGTSGARNFEKDITDMNQRFGLGDVGRLRNYRLGEENGYTGVESAGMIDRLRENRALDNPAQAGPLVNAIQEMTRALGLNAEATIEMVGTYSRTGGEKGASGARGYLADVVGGAIRSGFESNIQQYADMMGSARMQAVQTTGQGVSDRAFNLLQDVMGGLAGGNSRTSNLFRDNNQMAAMGMQSFLAMGGTANPYSTSAAYMRLAGINEANLDTRFNTTEQIAQNAQQSLGWTTGRLQEMSGMGAAEFQQNAQNSPNFIQDLLSNSVVMQRQTSHIVSGFLGREASANDLRAYEELTNIAAANGGQLPMEGSSPDSSRVNELLEQLQASPADEMRQKEAARHNRTMEVLSSFMDLQTRVDTWMTGIMDWLLKFKLEEVQKWILDAMTGIEEFVKWAMPHVGSGVESLIEMGQRVIQWADENNIVPIIGEWMEKIWAQIGLTIEAIRNPGKVAEGAASGTQQAWRRFYGEGENGEPAQNLVQRGGNYVDPVWWVGQGLGAAGRRLNILPDDQARTGPRRNRNLQPGRGAGSDPDDEFNDTPGTVTATPGYNTFRFAPGDVVSARQGSVPGGASLTDINLTLNQGMNLGVQQHRETLETAGLLQDVTNKIHELFGKTQADVENYVAKLFPALMDGQKSHIDLTAAGNAVLENIEKAIPGVVAAIDAVKEAISSMALASAAGMAGGMGGAGGDVGAFASGLFTGPRANIGGSSPNHIDTKIRDDTHWEDIDAYFVQMAEAYAQENRRIEFSNSRVSGQVFDPNADQADRIAMLQRAAAAHAPRPGWHSFDYYIPQGDDARSESATSSSAGAEIMLPTLPGGRVEYGQDFSTVGGYGNYANLYDEDGTLRFRTGHGDNRRAVPQGRAFPTAPPPGAVGGGGPVQLGEGYGSLEQLSQQLMANDERFNTNTPEGRAAMAIALGIGGAEVYSRGSTQTDFFTRRGGASLDGRRNTMLGFAQFNQDYHAEKTDTPAEYTQFLGDILHGEAALPNGRQGGNVAQRLSQAVQGGQIQSGAQLEQWMRQNQLGGSNWQGLDDGWRRVPGLSDQLLRMLQNGGGTGATGPRASTNNITVNIASANNRAEAEAGAREGIMAAVPALDEFEQRRQVDSNPRNRTGDRTLSPVYS